MNPFVVQNFSSNKACQFHNKPPQVYPQLVQNGYISSVGRNNMPRYPYHTASSYSLPTQNPKPLPENYMQFGPSSPLFNPIGQYSGSNWIGQNYSSPINVLSGKVPVQSCYISSVGRSNNMLRYTYHTASSYSQQQNSKPLLPENRLQFGTSSPQSNPIGRSRGLNLIEQNYPSPVNVLNGKVKGSLAEYTHQTKLFRANNEMTMKKHPSCTEAEFVVKNLTKFPFRSNTNRTRLLHAFNKNFNLSRPTILDGHDRKRKKIASVEEVVQNSYALLNAKSNKRTKPTHEAQNEHNKCMNNPKAMKKTEGPATSKIVIKEDENGYLRVCSESLLESNNLTKESVSSNLIGGNIKASLVDKDGDPTDLDLTLHL